MYQGYKELLVEKQNKVVLVKFNNPKKKNCVNIEGYSEISKVVQEAANDDSITLLVFTGVGDFYTAGNDLSQSNHINDFSEYIRKSNEVFKNMVRAFVDFPKIIVSLVNGPCIGIGATLAGISDLVWCSANAYFSTPFVKLGLVPEAGSSYLFPKIMGRSKASEILLFGEKLTAQEALKFNFASRIYRQSELDTVIWPKLREFSELPPQSLKISKKLIRDEEKRALWKAVELECEELVKRFESEEFLNALIQFTTRKSKL